MGQTRACIICDLVFGKDAALDLIVDRCKSSKPGITGLRSQAHIPRLLSVSVAADLENAV